MPIEPVAIQQANARLGMLRAGDQVVPEDGGRSRPRKLENWRCTSHNLVAMERIAALYGGEPQKWGRQWEVYTEVNKLDIALPPGPLAITQWMELWTGAGMARRCDGRTMRRPKLGAACMCPQPEDLADPDLVEQAIQLRKEMAARRTPAACKPYTRLNLVLCDVGDVGVWGLLTKSEQAAAEIAAKMRIIDAYRQMGQFLAAEVALEWRQLPVDGTLREFAVPVIRLGATIRELAEGTAGGGGLAGQLPPAPGQLAIARPTHTPLGITAGPAEPDIAITAQTLANRVLAAGRRPEVEALAEIAKRAQLADDRVWAPPAGAEPDGPRVEMPLSQAVNNRWHQLPPIQPATASA